jgi:hypothetical protein
VPQTFLEQVGAMQGRVGLGDPRDLCLLVAAEPSRVLPQRVPGLDQLVAVPP